MADAKPCLLIAHSYPQDLGVQKEWDDAMSDFLAETQSGFRTMAGPSFKNLIEVVNKRCRTKIKVKNRKALSNGVSTRAMGILKQVLTSGIDHY